MQDQIDAELELLRELTKEHEGHSVYTYGCRTCIHWAAFNFQHNIEEAIARGFLAHISIKVRNDAIAQVNSVFGPELHVTVLEGEIPA